MKSRMAQQQVNRGIRLAMLGGVQGFVRYESEGVFSQPPSSTIFGQNVAMRCREYNPTVMYNYV